MERVRVRVVDPATEGCGCLVSGLLVIAVIGAATAAVFGFGTRGVIDLGIKVYEKFHNGFTPNTGSNSQDYFYGCLGLAVVFAGVTVLATVTALFTHGKRATSAAVIFFIFTIAASVGTVILYNTYMKSLG